MSTAPPRPVLDVTPDGADLRLGLSGEWTLSGGLPSLQPVARQITQAAPHRLVFDARGLGRWDSTLISFAYELAELAKERGIDLEVSGLPPGAQKLLAIATAVPPRSLARPPVDDALTARVGRVALRASGTAGDAPRF